MTVIQFHCTFTERHISGHVHPHNEAGKSLNFIYAACLVSDSEYAYQVEGGIIVSTDMHDSVSGFRDMLIASCLKCPHLRPLLDRPFTLQPFRVPVLNSYLPLEDKICYELLFEKYLELSHQGKLIN